MEGIMLEVNEMMAYFYVTFLYKTVCFVKHGKIPGFQCRIKIQECFEQCDSIAELM